MTREEAIGLIKDHIDTYVVCHGEEDTVAVSIDNVDVEALTMAIKALEQEPSGDAISRQAVLDLCDMRDRYEIPYEYDEDGKHIKGYDEGRIINVTKLNKLSSVNPQEPKTGHWIKSNIPNEKYVCSECGGGCWYYDYQADVAKSRYCPNCGARMFEPQERSETE